MKSTTCIVAIASFFSLTISIGATEFPNGNDHQNIHSQRNGNDHQQLRDPKAADVRIVGHILEPKKFSPKNITEKLALPRGFSINVFAENLVNPRMIAVADNGDVYVTRRSVGDLIKLVDDDGDGVVDTQEVVANRPGMHGIALKGDTIYLATVNDIFRATILPDGKLSPLEHIVDDLPDSGQHPNRTLAIGPDGKLYVSVGSTCNACDESSPESATLLQMNPDGTGRKIFASGLRNTIGFAFEPGTGEIYGMDHGIDWLGDNEQYEELNHIVLGKQYGWPYVYGDSKFNPQDHPPANITMQEWAARSVEPLGFYTPHAAPMQMTFYTGTQFPGEYQGDAFIAMRGSWNRKPPAGYEIVRIHFDGGRPVKFEPFAQGFLHRKGDKWIHYGRISGLAQTKDGALLVADDANGVIYRIAYTGSSRKSKLPGAPTNSHDVDVRINLTDPLTNNTSHNPNLAMQLVSNASLPSLSVTSTAFQTNDVIPRTYALEGENISPPLAWSKGPSETKSYVVLMEDPDVAQNPPFVHWSIHDLPADFLSLPEGIPPVPELVLPTNTRQGKNDRGSLGYIGPNPPTTDPAHQYYFQVFALDIRLNLPVGVSREELVEAMKGHVVASGYLRGIYDR